MLNELRVELLWSLVIFGHCPSHQFCSVTHLRENQVTEILHQDTVSPRSTAFTSSIMDDTTGCE